MTIRERLKKLFRKKIPNQLEDNIKDYVKEKLIGAIEDQQSSVITNSVLKSLNEQMMGYGKNDLSKYMLDRLTRYSEYDIIQQKIPEQQKQLELYYDLTINPEVYTQDFLNIQINQEQSIFDIFVNNPIKKINGGDQFQEKKKINIQEYLNIYCRKNNLYKILKKQIYDQLFYGDGFIEITEPQDINKLDTDIFVTNYLNYQSISPKRVVMLQLENVSLGYLIIPEEINSQSLSEKELVIDFLLFLYKSLDEEQFKNFTKYQILSESSTTEIGNLMDTDKYDNYNRLNEQDEFTKLHEIISNNIELRKKFQNLIKEQTVNSQMFKDKFTLVFQMDLSKYMGNKGSSSINTDLEKLMQSDPLFQNLFKDTTIRYILPDNMQHLTLTNYRYYPYGQGILDAVRSMQSLILLLEYQMIIYRLTKQPDRKKYVIDITGIQKEKIPEYINRIKNELKSIKSIDVNGGIQENLDLITLMEDYFVLRKNGTDLLDIQNVEGQEMQKWYDDMKYWHDKLLSSLGIPPSYLGFQESLSGAQTVLAIQDHRVQRQIMRLQSDLNDGINDLFLHSFKILNKNNNKRKTMEIDKIIYSFLNNSDIEVKLFAPTSLEQKERAELISARFNMIKDLQQATNFNLNDLLIYFKIFTSTEIQKFEINKNIEEKDQEGTDIPK